MEARDDIANLEMDYENVTEDDDAEDDAEEEF